MTMLFSEALMLLVAGSFRSGATLAGSFLFSFVFVAFLELAGISNPPYDNQISASLYGPLTLPGGPVSAYSKLTESEMSAVLVSFDFPLELFTSFFSVSAATVTLLCCVGSKGQELPCLRVVLLYTGCH